MQTVESEDEDDEIMNLRNCSNKQSDVSSPGIAPDKNTKKLHNYSKLLSAELCKNPTRVLNNHKTPKAHTHLSSPMAHHY